jgi:hypothetical protein
MSSALGAGLEGIPLALFQELQKRIIAITVTAVLGGASVYIFKSEKDIAVRLPEASGVWIPGSGHAAGFEGAGTRRPASRMQTNLKRSTATRCTDTLSS